MKTRNLLMISAMAAALSFAAEEAAGPNAVEACQTAIDKAAKDIPANATSAKYTLAAAKSNLIALDAAYTDDAESDETKALAAKCDTYAKTIAAQAETQKYRNSTAEKWEKRAATARSAAFRPGGGLPGPSSWPFQLRGRSPYRCGLG